MATRLPVLALTCLAAVADSGTPVDGWRQCVADTPAAAIEACSSIIFLDPAHDGAYVNRGIAYRRLGDVKHALHDYSEAIRLNPKAADAFNNRGNVYRELHQLDSALRDYDEALRLNPSYAHAYNNRGAVLLELGEAEWAIADFQRAIDEDPTYANAFRNRGMAHLDRQRFALAVDDFERASALDPSTERGAEYAIALYGRGRWRQAQGDTRLGDADVAEALRLLPAVAGLAGLD